MKKTISLMLCVFILLGCGIVGCTKKAVPPVSTTPKTTSGIIEEQIDVVHLMEKMTLEEKVGQLFVVSLPDTELSKESMNFLEENKIGNVILFGKNTQNGAQIRELNTQIQDTIIKSTGIPGFIAIDQEGGSVTRIYEGATVFSGAMAVAATGDKEGAETLGSYMGEELRGLGIHFNFAPVADVNSNPQNPVINVRSYGDNPNEVADYVKNMVKGLQSKNVIAAAKHFPGHGDTAEDTHYGLPSVNKTLEELTEMELKPFQAAINAGVGAIMTTHILFPQIEQNKLPATLSKTILQDVLRQKMGFEGLIVSDSMNMDAIAEFYGIGNACVLAVNAGVNLIITGSGGRNVGEYEYQKEAYETVLRGVKNGEVSEKTLNASVRKILEYKNRYDVMEEPYPSAHYEDIDFFQHASFAQQISKKSITVVADTKKLLPVEGRNTLVISADTTVALDEGDVALGEENSFAYQMSQQTGCDYMVVKNTPSVEQGKEMKTRATHYDTVVIASNGAKNNGAQALAIQGVIDSNPRTIVVGLSSPYDFSAFENLSTFVCGYEYTALSVRNLVAVLSGEQEATGKLPIDREKMG